RFTILSSREWKLMMTRRPQGIPYTNDMLRCRLKDISKKVKASKTEVDENPRSRSAVMRVTEKIA
ncbi:MAG: 16S rRNA (cytosine(1402)-N(4))-methyltransferase, partial [Oceanospirillaceae bacterium]